jgi:Domain of unknown function (DUF4760)
MRDAQLLIRLNLMSPKPIKFKFPVKATLLSILLALMVSATYASVQDTKSRESIAFTVTTLTAALGGLAAFYALQELKQSFETRNLEEEARRVERTMELISKWDEEQFAKARITIADLLKPMSSNPNQSKELSNQLQSNPSAQQDATLSLNLLEKISVFCEAGLLNERLLKNFYRPIVLRCWDVLNIYIIERRKEMNDELYEGLEKVYHRWK